MEQEELDKGFKGWVLVELMGRQALAGYASETTVAGARLLRMDVPETKDAPAFTKLLGVSAIYAITPLSEQDARSSAAWIQAVPLPSWMQTSEPESDAEGQEPQRGKPSLFVAIEDYGEDDDSDGDDSAGEPLPL